MQATLVERLEKAINSLMIRFAPVWYATQALQRMSLPDYAPLNPLVTDANQWFNLPTALNSACAALLEEGNGWQGLAKELEHLAVQKLIQRPVSLTRLTGAHHLPPYDGFSAAPTLREAVLALENDQAAIESDEAFDNLIRALPRSLQATHREWDGRLLLNSHELLEQMIPLIEYAGVRQRDAMVPANLIIEGVRQEALERIRTKYWWFVMHPDSAQALTILFSQCGFSAAHSGPVGPTEGHAFFFAPKSSQRLNKVVLQLMSSRRSTQLSEFGRFLSKHRHRFRTP